MVPGRRVWGQLFLLSTLAALPFCDTQGNSSGGFSRLGPYSYNVCANQPGNVPLPNNSSFTSAACIPIDPGQLTFCGSVSYTACMRDPSPTSYDSRILKAYTARTARLALEAPAEAPDCLTAFQSYLCILAFPQCITDPGGSGSQVEVPICYSYCMSAEMACGSNGALAQAACQRAVLGGRVAPDRPDVQCISCAARAAARTLLAALLCVWAAVLELDSMMTA